MSIQPRRRRLEVEDIGDVTVVNFTDKKILDEENIRIIGDQLFSLVEDMNRRKILLNFSNVEHMSSALIGKLITLKKLVVPDGRLALCEVDPLVYLSFSSVLMNRLFETEPGDITHDQESALKLFT